MRMFSRDRRSAVLGGTLGRLALTTVAALLISMAASPARASFQFADWASQPSNPATVSWTYDSGSGTASLSGSIPVVFRFDNISSLPSNLQAATLTITASTNIAATLISGPNLITEPLSGSIAISNGTNLLTIGFTGAIMGQQGGSNATVGADVTVSGQIVTFSSDDITFLNPSDNSFQMILPTIATPPGLSLNSSSFINNFTSNLLGSASVANANAIDPIPEPASLVSVCTGLAATGFFVMMRRRRKPS
jgi:hypothetical protein